MTARASSNFVVAVAVLMLMGHICAGPLHAHAGTVTTHSEEHHGQGGDDECVHGASCEALRATPSITLPALPAARLDVVPLAAVLAQIARPLPAPDTSPPLFLLHSVLQI